MGSFSLYIAQKSSVNLLIIWFMDAMATLNAIKVLNRFLVTSN